MKVMVGAVVVKVAGLDVPPADGGLATVTVALPGAATSAAMMSACNFVLLTNVVVRPLPFQFTVEPCTKFAPLTFIVKATAPAGVPAGEIVATEGAGVGVGTGVGVGVGPGV